VSGKVIAASASSAAVQQTSGPQTIAFSSQTRFTSTSSATRASLVTGDCVSVESTDAGSSVSGSRPTPGATPSFPTTLTAREITITSTSGCPQPTGGQGGFGEFPRGGFTPPPGATASSGAVAGGAEAGGSVPGPTTFRGRFGGAFGTITAIAGSSITVKSTFGGSATTAVKTTSSTTYVTTASVSASAVKKGLCVTAIGADDVSGVLNARSVSISQPVNGSCPAQSFSGGGFGGPGFVTNGNGPGGPAGA
jgi:hypothetical protein